MTKAAGAQTHIYIHVSVCDVGDIVKKRSKLKKIYIVYTYIRENYNVKPERTNEKEICIYKIDALFTARVKGTSDCVSDGGIKREERNKE